MTKPLYYNSFNEHLEIIRRRPTTSLGVKSIITLDTYLEGYLACAIINSVNEPFGDVPDLRDYNLYVKEKLGHADSTLNWARVILQTVGYDEEKAFDKFFELLDEFKKDYKM